MTPFQIPVTGELAPIAAKVNADLAGYQGEVAQLTQSVAFDQAYEDAVVEYAGSPRAGMTLTAALAYADATTSQLAVFDGFQLAGPMPADIDAILANPLVVGPIGNNKESYWNNPFSWWGPTVVPNTSGDPSLQQAVTVVAVVPPASTGLPPTITRTTGMALPPNVAE